MSDLAELAEMDPEMGEAIALEVADAVKARATLGASLLSALMNRAEAAEEAASLKSDTSSGSGSAAGPSPLDGSSPELEGAILEVRCGTGGDEAALFASEILDMCDEQQKRRQRTTVHMLLLLQNFRQIIFLFSPLKSIVWLFSSSSSSFLKIK